MVFLWVCLYKFFGFALLFDFTVCCSRIVILLLRHGVNGRRNVLIPIQFTSLSVCAMGAQLLDPLYCLIQWLGLCLLMHFANMISYMYIYKIKVCFLNYIMTYMN
jgi:hypothetical protein